LIDIKEIKRHKKNKLLDSTDYDGTLEILWYHYGVDKHNPSAERKDMLQQWINIIYPAPSANRISIGGRLNNVHTQHIAIMKRMKATCILFCDELDAVVKGIGNDFSLYVD